MIKRHRKALLITLCLIILGLTSGAMSLKAMVDRYSGICAPLDGVPGLLQKAGFVPLGHCTSVKVNGLLSCRKAYCEVKGKTGFCEKVYLAKVPVCACVPINTSK